MTTLDPIPGVRATRQKIVALNPGRDPRDLLFTPTWDLRHYDRKNIPIIVGEIPAGARELFSQPRGDRAQDLCIRMPRQGWQLPRWLDPYLPALKIAAAAERACNPDFLDNEDQYYAYVTVDQKVVAPHRTQRRQGFHGDAFLTPENADLSRVVQVENTYLVSDCLPTDFRTGPFYLGDVYPDDAACLASLDWQALRCQSVRVAPYAVARITPFHVHSPAVNDTDAEVQRTFLKITFSRERFNRVGNAQNPLLDYDGWFWVPRKDGIRNHRSVLLDWSRPDADQFMPVTDPSHLDGRWCDLQVFWAYKTQGVRAERAVKNRALETRVGSFTVSVNYAQEGDWLITSPQGDQYFLCDAKFRARYHEDPEPDGTYLPIPNPLPMVRITAPIRFRAPWGAMQYAAPGSVLVLKKDDVYAVHADSFAKNYRRVGAAQAQGEDPELTREVVETVRDAARRAADLLRRDRDRARVGATRKADGTACSPLDLEVQRMYVEALLSRPSLVGHVHVVAEESFAAAGIPQELIDANQMSFGSAEYVVAIDPLDNTRGYLESDTGNYATVAAVLHRGNPAYYVAVVPSTGTVYEGAAGRGVVAERGDALPSFGPPLVNPPHVLAAGLYWAHDLLAPVLPKHFLVTDRFGCFQLAVARMTYRDVAQSCDAVITSGFPYHETIPAAAVLALAGAATVRPSGLSFFPLQWSDLGSRRPHQLIGGATAAVNKVRQLRAEHPFP